MSKKRRDPLEAIIRYFQSTPLGEAERALVVARILVESRKAAPSRAAPARRERAATMTAAAPPPAVASAPAPAADPAKPARGRPVGAVDKQPRVRRRRKRGLAAAQARGPNGAKAVGAPLPEQVTDVPDEAAEV
jgi:hypothetical protein